MAISEQSTIQLITSAEEADLSRQIALLMNGIKSANVPLQTNPHGLYVRTFQNEEKIPIEVPPEYDEMVSLLVDAIGDFYTFQEISERAGRAALDLRRTISLDIQGAAMELTQSFSRPLEDAIKEPSIYFVPLSGVNIAVPVLLGPATFLPTEQAQTLVVEWKQRHNVASDPIAVLPSVRDLTGGYLRIEVPRATSKRQDELLQRRAEDGVNLLRYWLHHISGFDMFYNRPHIGSDPPYVNVLGLSLSTQTSITSGTLYPYSLGFTAIGPQQVLQMNLGGLSEMIAWHGAERGTARAATLLAAIRLGRAWSLLTVEDRIIASFSAFEGWLHKGKEQRRPSKSEVLSRRIAVLMTRDTDPLYRMQEQVKDMYRSIRSEVAHGGELRKYDAEWVDRITTNIGVIALSWAITLIRRQDGLWSVEDFWRDLDAQAERRPPT